MTAPTEQTEAQDDGMVAKLRAMADHVLNWNDGLFPHDAHCEGADNEIGVCACSDRMMNELLGEAATEVESLRAQLEAARELAIDRELELSAHRVESSTLRADLAQKMQEHQDALSEMRGRIAELEEAAVDIAHGMHQEPQYILMRGLNLIDGNRIKYKLRNGKVIDAALSPPSAGAV